MRHREITAEDDAALADLVRRSLKEHGLALPGTVYFDEGLDHLSDFYLAVPEKRTYFILLDDDDAIAGGCGLAEFSPVARCAEMQKLYLTDAAKGKGLGYFLIGLVEKRARELGYEKIYLETHTNLKAAIHIYEKSGFAEIEKPAFVVHSTMNKFYTKDI